MKALIHFLVGDDARLAIIAIVAIATMWALHGAPFIWLAFPVAIAGAVLFSVFVRPRL